MWSPFRFFVFSSLWRAQISPHRESLHIMYALLRHEVGSGSVLRSLSGVADSLDHGSAKSGLQCYRRRYIATSLAGNAVLLGLYSAIRHLVPSVRPTSSALFLRHSRLLTTCRRYVDLVQYSNTRYTNSKTAAAVVINRDTSWAFRAKSVVTENWMFCTRIKRFKEV